MKLQSADYDCAIVTIQNALRVIGSRVAYRTIRTAMRDPSWDIREGADEVDILRALAKLGQSVRELETDHKRHAAEWLETLAPAAPLILCVDDWRHWVAVAGVCGGRYLLQDPENTAENTAELGNHWLRPSTILRRWRASRKRPDEGGLYYGIALLPGSLVPPTKRHK